ncbi:MAG: hypothetical protein LQ352_005055 [Teloschistes flavicans]|nr:MAG: hypothetical protein LQ352_005055 [Teloschistes flavicans]
MRHNWNFLISKIHKPLPLDRRESQKLLGVLNSSFQRHLDRHYPQGLAGSEQSPDLHIDSLLKSPLFGTSRVQRRSSYPRQDDNIRMDTSHARDMMFALEEPVEYFKHQVSTGSATLASANLALVNQTNKALASVYLDPKESMKASGIGSVMINWLWSSGQYEWLDFLNDQIFVTRLMSFLVVEGQYKPVWRWLQHARNSLAQNNPAQLQGGDALLRKNIRHLWCTLTKSERRYGQGLQSAMQMFMTSYRSMELSTPAISVRNLQSISARAGQYLVWDFSHEHPSSPLEDAVIEEFDRFVGKWAYGLLGEYYRALIQISHPRQPNTAPALSLLAKIQSSEIHVIRPNQRLFVLRIGLKTVEVLLEQGSFPEAASVMKTLQTEFPSELGLNTESPARTETEQSVTRASSLILAV